MARTYDQHRETLEAAQTIPPADWQALTFQAGYHDPGEVGIFRATVAGQDFVFHAHYARVGDVDEWSVNRFHEVGHRRGDAIGAHRQLIVGPFKSWRHCRDAFWPYWRRTVLGLQSGEVVNSYGADVFDDPRASESDLTRIRFERGEERLTIAPDFDRDETSYAVTGSLGTVAITGVRTSADSTTTYTRNGSVISNLASVAVSAGTNVAVTVRSQDRSTTTVYVFRFANG